MTEHYRPEGSFLSRGLTRREMLGAIGVAAIGAGLAGAEAKSRLVSRSVEWVRAERLTKEQKEAAELLKNNSGQFVENIQVLEVTENGKVVPINLRNKPRVPFDETDSRAGEIVGHLKAGVVIAEALAVEGNNPLNSWDRNSKSTWYAFFDPNNPERVVFAYSGNFRPFIKGRPLVPTESKE